MDWNKKEISGEEVRDLCGRYGIDLITASILQRRGITQPEELQFYLEKDLRFLHNPFEFVEMEDTVERIIQAAEEEEKVKVFGDRDADGITSTVLMVGLLSKMGIDVSWALPQGDEPYGLTRKAVDDFYAEGGSLFITVDCGISNVDEIKYAASLGIDTLVLDHHNPPEEIPPAYAIINPKMEDSGYPFRDLAGCGVVSKVSWAVMFSRTEFYNQSICLLNIVPARDSYVIEAVRLVNLVETDRIREVLVPGLVNLEKTRLESFFSQQLFAYQTKAQEEMLRTIFGARADIHLTDMAPRIWKTFPAMEGMSLLKLREKSRIARYRENPTGELDIFTNLFISFVLKSSPELSEGYRQDLDLVAMGTLADLMPLRGENRILIKQGMEVLNTKPRPCLAELMTRQNIGGKTLTPTDVGWQLTPVINATGRMGEPEKAARLFLSDQPAEMSLLADQVVELNRERKKIGEKAWERLLPEAKRSYQDSGSKLVFVAHRELQRGITGILASRLVKFFGVPAIALSLLDDKAVGSMRSFKGFNAKDFLAQASELFMDYGGHDYAAGFSLEIDRLDLFRERLTAMVENLKTQEVPREFIEVDAELQPKHLTPELIQVVERLEPYGEGSPPLVFLVRGLPILEAAVMGKGEVQHLRLLLDSGDYKWPAVYWNSAGKLGREFGPGDRADVVFRLGRNYFQNRESLQLTILDLKKCV